MTTNPTHTTVHAGTWVVDTTGTTAAFHGVGLGGAKVRGTIPVEAGRVEVGGSGRVLSVDAVLDATGIDTGNARRDKDLRSKRFLTVTEYPVIRFAARSVERTATGWTVDGRLTAGGGECALTLAVELVEGEPADPAGAARLRAQATFDRRDLGIKAPSFLVRRRVRLEIDALLRPPTGR